MSENNTSPTHREIADLARQLWEEAGQPEGQAEAHWRRAEEQLSGSPGESQQTESIPA